MVHFSEETAASNIFSIPLSDNDRDFVSLQIKEWETKFFRKKFGLVTIHHEKLGQLEPEDIYKPLDSLLSHADKKQFSLLELPLNILGIKLCPVLEERGFRLVDTKITFFTLMNKDQIEDHPTNLGEICFATEDMMGKIVNLTHQAFSHNTAFFSRFKSEAYFSKEETERYYSAWIKNHLGKRNILFAVIQNKEDIIGYLIYKRVGQYEERPVYKGVLVAVDQKYRGKKLHLALQSFVYRYFPEDAFYLETTTQLGNLSTIKNYIKSKKIPEHIELIFYRRPSEIGKA